MTMSGVTFLPHHFLYTACGRLEGEKNNDQGGMREENKGIVIIYPCLYVLKIK